VNDEAGTSGVAAESGVSSGYSACVAAECGGASPPPPPPPSPPPGPVAIAVPLRRNDAARAIRRRALKSRNLLYHPMLKLYSGTYVDPSSSSGSPHPNPYHPKPFLEQRAKTEQGNSSTLSLYHPPSSLPRRSGPLSSAIARRQAAGDGAVVVQQAWRALTRHSTVARRDSR